MIEIITVRSLQPQVKTELNYIEHSLHAYKRAK